MSKSDQGSVSTGPGGQRHMVLEHLANGQQRLAEHRGRLWQRLPLGGQESRSQKPGAGTLNTTWLYPILPTCHAAASLDFQNPELEPPHLPTCCPLQGGLRFSSPVTLLFQPHWACRHSSADSAAPLLEHCS